MKAITASEVTKKVIHNEELFILDVRNETDFNDWKIEGKNFEYLNVPYFDLLDGVEPILDKIPADKELLVVCVQKKVLLSWSQKCLKKQDEMLPTSQAG
ncbi:hypothetical protein ABE37_17925 [Cytobacillus firmus]|nr:hypothetical protein [Cytobacillus firmus]